MATTGVPNQLYQGSDAPDLVAGAFATHTHGIKTYVAEGNSNGHSDLEVGNSFSTQVVINRPEGASTMIGILSIKPTNVNAAISGFSITNDPDYDLVTITAVNAGQATISNLSFNVKAVYI